MSLEQFPNMEQRTDEWYAARRGIVTASVVGQLVTGKTLKVADNDYSRAIVAQLAAERITGTTDATFANDDMLRGVLDEPFAVEKYAEHYGDVTTTGFMVRREDGWTLGFSPDGLVGDDGLLEIKCPRAKTHIRTVLADAVPPNHVAQIQAGLLVSGRDWLDFVSYCGGLALYVKRVYPDPRWFAAIEEACRRFQQTADEMVAEYTRRAATLPATERIDAVVF